MSKQKGFTLVELLVVIAIIGILVGALMLAINPVAMMQRSRDSTRMQDMVNLRDAINLAIAEQNATLADTTGVCATCTSTAGTRAVDGTGWVVLAAGSSLAQYVSTLPIDPTNDATYFYSYASDGTAVELNCILEHADNVATMGADGGNNANVYEIGSSLTLIN